MRQKSLRLLNRPIRVSRSCAAILICDEVEAFSTTDHSSHTLNESSVRGRHIGTRILSVVTIAERSMNGVLTRRKVPQAKPRPSRRRNALRVRQGTRGQVNRLILGMTVGLRPSLFQSVGLGRYLRYLTTMVGWIITFHSCHAQQTYTALYLLSLVLPMCHVRIETSRINIAYGGRRIISHPTVVHVLLVIRRRQDARGRVNRLILGTPIFPLSVSRP